jgi:hypothetical protein
MAAWENFPRPPMSRKPATTAAPRAAPGLDRALRQLLRPLVRLLLAKGVQYPALAAMLKDVYFEVASEDFAAGGEQTASQISLISGLHRKDVRRMRDTAPRRPAVSLETSLSSQVFTRWITDRRFLDARNRPRALPRLASTGGERSFEALAVSISKDVRARALLDELVRLELVTLDDGDNVRLNHKAFVPKRGSGEAMYYFGENIRDHLATAVHNLLGREPERLEQAIFGDELSPESVEELAGLVRREWARLAREIVPRASELDARDAKAGRTGMRMRFGIYFHAEHNDKPAAKNARAGVTQAKGIAAARAKTE